MRKRKKRVVSVMAAATFLVGSIGITGLNWTASDIKADTTVEESIFMVGQNTGTNFGDLGIGGWIIKGTDNYGNDLTGGPYAPGLMEDPYKNAKENVIRLINGVTTSAENNGLYSADDNNGNATYRSGSAFIKRKVTLNDNYQFSAKFTISMPDACIDDAGVYTREPGGDGIAFVIQPDSDPTGTAGGGMGYQGIDNSLIVEMDSFFNGGYYYKGDKDGFDNWGFSNQVYIYGTGTYLDPTGGPYSHDNYQGLPANPQQRFDHIGIMTGGNQQEHLAVAYLGGNDPCEWDGTNNTYVNMNKNISGQNGYENTAANSFAKAGENNRLFTVWVQYDGETLTARVSTGDFLNADYDAPIATLSKAIPVNDMKGYLGNNKDVYVGFTSAVGSSKANHTVHSLAFSNKYYENGIPDPEYTIKYWVEKTNEPSNPANEKTVNGITYVLKETSAPVEVANGTSIKPSNITNAQKNKYAGYVYSAADTELVVKLGGDNVYNIYYKSVAATYTIEYYKEKSDGTGFEKVVADTESNLTSTIGSRVDISVGRNLANKYSSEGFKLDTTVSGTLISKTLDSKETIFKVYYINATSAPYVVEYYIKNDGDTEYKKSTDLTENKTGTIGDTVSVTPPTTITVGGKTYTFDKDNNGNILTLEIKDDGSAVFKLYFEEVKEDVTEPATTEKPTTPDAPQTRDVIGDRLKIAAIAIAVFGMTVVGVNSKRRKKN
ncbi:MAG: hypothetical protein K2M73_06755 [Lachnospiraceae bacterium]|nr:hypothetical protein [Lachnospiraceae bacterium]MDE6698733.1 hypothetical protein [Lachnospiraceae bacterium]